MRVAYFYLTSQGEKLAQSLRKEIDGTCYGKEDLKQKFAQAFANYDALICIMATGIVVRLLAPHLEHKTKDPAVVVLDQQGSYVISLLSGHLGGANDLARRIAPITGGQAVITTATDVERQLAFDVYAKQHEMKIENIEQLKYISSALLDGKKVEVFCWNETERKRLEDDWKQKNWNEKTLCFVDRVEEMKEPCRVYISPYQHTKREEIHCLLLRPPVVTIGIGCKKNRTFDGATKAIEEVCQKAGVSTFSIKQIATIPRKGEEPVVQGLVEFYQVPLRLVEEREIEELDLDKLQVKQSDFVKKTVGVASVSTASAYIASNHGKILVDKQCYMGMTLSVALERK